MCSASAPCCWGCQTSLQGNQVRGGAARHHYMIAAKRQEGVQREGRLVSNRYGHSVRAVCGDTALHLLATAAQCLLADSLAEHRALHQMPGHGECKSHTRAPCHRPGHVPVMRISYRKGVEVPTQRRRGLRVLHVLLAATCLRMRALCGARLGRARSQRGRSGESGSKSKGVDQHAGRSSLCEVSWAPSNTLPLPATPRLELRQRRLPGGPAHAATNSRRSSVPPSHRCRAAL